MNFALPNRAFADGGMENLLLEKMTDDYHPVDVNLPALNSVLGNFNSFKGIGLGNLVVLGGAPKSMKTTTALYWMRRASETPGIRPVLLTWEMTEDDSLWDDLPWMAPASVGVVLFSLARRHQRGR